MFEKVNISDCMVIVGLVTALLMAIFFGMNELAMSVASGLIGWLGASAKKGETK